MNPRTASATFPAYPAPSARSISPAPSRRSGPARERVPQAFISATTIADRQVPGFHIAEIQYPAGFKTGALAAGKAQVIYLLDGEYVETYTDGSKVACQARSLRYLPPRFTYASASESGARCLIVTVDSEVLTRVEKLAKSMEHPATVQTPACLWLTHKLYREFQQNDASSAISLEGILLELLAETARYAGSGPVRIVPEWLRTARAYVETNYLRPLSLADIARVAHVHRVHLARQFRSYFSTSVGELLRRKRVEHACHLVSTTNCSLAEVAIDCGFSDQSHFSATFRKLMGLTPARFREMAQSPASGAEAKFAYAGKS